MKKQSLFILCAIFSLYPLGLSAQITATSFSLVQPVKSTNAFTNSQPKTVSQYAPKVNPNQINLQGFLYKVREMGKNNPEINGIIDQIKIDVATTTNLMNLFLKDPDLIRTSQVITSETSPKERFSSFFDFLKPKKAIAATTLPFGGPLLYSYYCSCSFTWLIWVGPTASVGTSNMILDYVTASQGFLSYNIPYTSKLMGKYTPGTSMCYIYYGYGCVNVPVSYGMITPLVGSSAQ